MDSLNNIRGTRSRLGNSTRQIRRIYKLPPTIVFFVALVASMIGLAYAMRALPVGTSYAVWVGIGAVLTVTYAMLTGTEQASIVKIALLLMIIAGIIGLKLLHN